MGVRRNFSRGGPCSHFVYPFQVFDDAVQTDVHKTFYPFYTTKKMLNVTATVANSAPSKDISVQPVARLKVLCSPVWFSF